MIQELILSLPGRIKRNPVRYAGLSIIIVLCFIAIFSDALAPYPTNYHVDALLPPSWEYPFGTNSLGQDMLSQVIRGTVISIEIGVMSALISIGIGVTVGAMAGYYRGWIEQFLLSVTDAFIIIPSLPLMIVFVAYTKSSSLMIILAISILAWCPMARIIHPRVLSIVESPFVKASRMLGKSNLYILVHHIIPNCGEIVTTRFATAVGAGMLAEASLSFMGLGDRFSSSWGTMVNEAFRYGSLQLGYWWWYLIPSLMISISVISFMMLAHSSSDRTGVVE